MIKKLAVLFCFVLIFTLTGCKNNENISSDGFSNESSATAISVPNNESGFETTTDNIKPYEEQESVTSKTQSYIETEEKTNDKNIVDKPSVSSAEQHTDNIQSEASSEPQIQNAAAADSKGIAELIVKYINEYRNKNNSNDAIILSGLTEYAEYRSRQLVSNFSHNTADERKAATELKYGKYIEPALYGMTGEPYYTACAGEAIVKAGYAGTKEYVAESIAMLVFNSAAHWSYVGNPANKYIAVGVTYESGLWYCDIAVTDVNYDEGRN